MKIKRSEKVIKQDKVTVVKDDAYIIYESGPVGKLVQEVESLLWDLGEPIHTTGVAKCHPDDQANEVTGKIVASLKAEKKLNNQLYNKLLKLHHALHMIRTELIKTMGKLVIRNDAIESKLEEFK